MANRRMSRSRQSTSGLQRLGRRLKVLSRLPRRRHRTSHPDWKEQMMPIAMAVMSFLLRLTLVCAPEIARQLLECGHRPLTG